MPAKGLKTLLKKSNEKRGKNKTMDDVERYWREAKQSSRDKGFTEDEEQFWEYTMGIVMRRLGLRSKSSFKAELAFALEEAIFTEEPLEPEYIDEDMDQAVYQFNVNGHDLVINAGSPMFSSQYVLPQVIFSEIKMPFPMISQIIGNIYESGRLAKAQQTHNIKETYAILEKYGTKTFDIKEFKSINMKRESEEYVRTVIEESMDKYTDELRRDIVKVDRNTWDFAFMTDGKIEQSVKTGMAFRILTTVMHYAIRFLDEYKPMVMTFTPTSGSRARIYERAINKHVTKQTGYKIVSIIKNFDEQDVFLMTKGRKLIT